MSVRVTCRCGTSYELKDELAGRLVKCPQCGQETRAPGGPATGRPHAVFDRDVFLLRQQLLRISEQYDVGDERGNKFVFVERPAHLLQNLGALLAAVVAIAVVLGITVALAEQYRGSPVAEGLATLGMLGAIVAAAAVGLAISAKRHVTFYRDATKRERLMDVLQDRKWQPITATYTLRDSRGQLRHRGDRRGVQAQVHHPRPLRPRHERRPAAPGGSPHRARAGRDARYGRAAVITDPRDAGRHAPAWCTA